MKAIFFAAFSAFGLHSSRSERYADTNVAGRPPNEHSPRHSPLWTWMRLVMTAAFPGHGSFGYAAWMTAPAFTITSRPTCRVSPSAMVLTARSPKPPSLRMRLHARKKKYATRSAEPRLPSAMCETSQSRNAVPVIPLIRFPPKKGGLPTMASKPPRSCVNTSGNSNGQWKGRRADLSAGRSVVSAAIDLRRIEASTSRSPSMACPA